jgi:hypothetical protein
VWSILVQASFHVGPFFFSRGPTLTASSAQFFLQFFYRFNSNGTMDSICSLCFQTVATVGNQAELRNLEAAHHCQGG